MFDDLSFQEKKSKMEGECKATHRAMCKRKYKVIYKYIYIHKKGQESTNRNDNNNKEQEPKKR